jgi:aminoglycoside phosphotransferase (APT) family kinase protein
MTPQSDDQVAAGEGTFALADARRVLDKACHKIGASAENAGLIRLGENAIFGLPQEKIVVRIARSAAVLGDAEKEVAVASWLRDVGIPAAEPTAHPQPLLVLSHPVTFWRLIDDSGAKPALAELGRILRRLHAAPVPEELPLPPFDIFGRVAERITASAVLAETDRQFLADKLADLRVRYAEVKFPLPAAAVHGDAHQANLIEATDGEVLLIDFERFAFGPPETDLAVTATEYLLGWHSDPDYASFCQAYGFDVTAWKGFPVLRAINELKMTTWLMQNVGESEQIADEFRLRLASLHDDDAPRNWHPY